MKKIIILIPVYNDWESLNKLLIKINENIKFINIDYKIPENINESELFYNRTYLNYVKKQ